MAERGISADFRLDNSGGSLTDISTKLTSVEMPQEVELYDTTTFQAAGGARTYLAGFQNATISIEGLADAAIASHLIGIKGQEATVSFQYGPRGSTSTYRKFTGEAILMNYNETTDVDDVNHFTAQLQVTGAITVGAY